MHKKTLTMTSYLGKVAARAATLSKKRDPQGLFPVSFTLFSDYFFYGRPTDNVICLLPVKII